MSQGLLRHGPHCDGIGLPYVDLELALPGYSQVAKFYQLITCDNLSELIQARVVRLLSCTCATATHFKNSSFAR